MTNKIVIDTQTALKKEVNAERADDSKSMIEMRIEARFGQNVRWYRKQRQLTQDQLAFLCELNQNYISEIEQGKRNVTLRVLNSVAEALGVKVEELLR